MSEQPNTTNRPCPKCGDLMVAFHYPRFIKLLCVTCGHSESVK